MGLRLVAAAAALALALAPFADRGHQWCAELTGRADPGAVIASCTADYEQTGDLAAAVAVVNAHVARARASREQPGGDGGASDDAAVVAWAGRVGDAPGAALIWRRAWQVHARRGERAAMLGALQRAQALWERAGARGEAAYEAVNLEDAYWKESQLLPALQWARRGRALALGSDDRQMQIVSFGVLFSVLDEIGDQRGASALLEEVRRQTPLDAAAVRYFLHFYEGLLRFNQRQYELARQAYRAALALPDAVHDPDTDRAARYNLVEIEVLLGEFDAAAQDLDAAVAQLPAAPPPYMRFARAFFSGLLANARGDHARAEVGAREALAQQPSPDWEWQLQHLLGRALEAQGRRDDALAAYRRAIAVVEQMRRELALDVLQLHLRERKRAPYEAAFALEAAAGDTEAAMALAELMWQRGFAESFAEPDEAAAGGGGGAADPAADRICGVTEVVPRLARGAASPPIGVSSAPLTSPQGAGDLLAFVEARGALWRYSRIAAGVQLERLSLSAADARSLVDDLRADPDAPAVAARLGEALIPRAAVDADARAPLAIIADGAVAGLPFAALRVGGAWLVERRVLVYQPGLAATETGGVSRPPGDPRAAVVMAAPGPGGALPAAAAEAVAVAQRLGVSPLVGDRATRAALERARTAEVLHVAAHGGIAPGGAFLRLADGDVTVADVLRWDTAPRLVVLASCASGARAGGSIWGAMGGAFLAAGSRTVIATLWPVEDGPTAVLVRDFYAASGAREPSVALAAAQRRAIAAGVAPRQWAAFLALGAP